MEVIFFLLRLPVYLIGLVLCLFMLPFDFAYLFLVDIASNAFIFVLRALGAPFIIIASAWFDRSSWPNYLKAWEKEHNSVKPDWNRPIRRLNELTTWLTEGPGGIPRRDKYCAAGDDCTCSLPKICLRTECDCSRPRACTEKDSCSCGRTLKVCTDPECVCDRPFAHKE